MFVRIPSIADKTRRRCNVNSFTDKALNSHKCGFKLSAPLSEGCFFVDGVVADIDRLASGGRPDCDKANGFTAIATEKRDTSASQPFYYFISLDSVTTFRAVYRW